MRIRGSAWLGVVAVGIVVIGVSIADPFRGRVATRRGRIPTELTSRGQEIVAGRVLLRARRPLPARLLATLEQQGLVLEEILDDRIEVLSLPFGVPPEFVAEAFAMLPEVELAELDGIAHVDAPVNDPQSGAQWHLAKVRAEAAWTLSLGSADVAIAVLDTGCDPSHPDLAEKLLPGWSFVSRSANTADGHGHGTHVAGIAAAATDNAVGVAGLGRLCSILPVQVLDETGSGSYSAVASGIRWAADRGARVVNLSLGGTAPSTTLESAVRYATRSGALVVAAAGNSNTTEPSYPAFLEDALAVGASTPSDARASFSNHGPWVDLAAPGTSILSTFPMAPVTLGSQPSGYSSMSGTSMSAPVVAGTAGLVYALLGTRATPAAVRAALGGSAAPLSSPWAASGRLDAGAAMSLAAAPPSRRAGTVRSVVVVEGRWRQGDVSSLASADRDRLRVASLGPRGTRAVEVEVDVDGLGTVISSLLVDVDARSSASARQRISFWSWNAGEYVERDDSFVNARVGLRRVDLSGLAGSYVQGGMLRLRIRQESARPFTTIVGQIAAEASGD